MKDHIHWLKDQVAEFEARAQAARQAAEHAEAVLANLKATVEVLAGSAGNGPAAPIAETKPLKRNPALASLSLIDAAKQLLEASAGEPLHHDELCRAIFELENDDLKRARSCLTSMLSVGAKRGLFKALGAGRYTANGQGQVIAA